VEHSVQFSKRAQTMSAPPLTNRIVTSAEGAKVTLPDAPQMPFGSLPVVGQPAMVADAGLARFAAATPSASAFKALPTGAVTAFGFRGSRLKGFKGELFDAKLTPDGKPRTGNVTDLVLEFESKNYDLAVLKDVFRAPCSLVATRFWIPLINASKGPEAFGAQGIIRPNQMMVRYSARLIAPARGTYRFFAFGDNFLGVKFNDAVVIKVMQRGEYVSPFAASNGWYKPRGHAVSKPISIQAGQVCSMEVILVETGGGASGYNLLFQREEDLSKYEKNSDGKPMPLVFETETQTEIEEPKPGNYLPEKPRMRQAWRVVE
jgi:hypothetical protein